MRPTLVLWATNRQHFTKIIKQTVAEAPQYLKKLKNDPKKQLEILKTNLKQGIAEAPQYLQRLKIDQGKKVYEKIKYLNKCYIKAIGLDEVKVYQERVTALQDQLLTTQTKKREINRQLTEVRQRAQDIQSQIRHINRTEKYDKYSQLINEKRENQLLTTQNKRKNINMQLTEVQQQAQDIQSQIPHIDRTEKVDKYCQLINEKRKVSDLKRKVINKLQDCDQSERDLFTAFTNAIRDSQEKQRTQIEYSKYLYLALCMFCSFLTFLYGFIHKEDLKKFIDKKISSLSKSEEQKKSQNWYFFGIDGAVKNVLRWIGIR